MCKFLPKPTRTLRVMRLFESSLKFIVVSNNNMRRSVAALQWRKDSENEATSRQNDTPRGDRRVSDLMVWK